MSSCPSLLRTGFTRDRFVEGGGKGQTIYYDSELVLWQAVEYNLACYGRDAPWRVSPQVLLDRVRMRTTLVLVEGSQTRSLSAQGLNAHAKVTRSQPRTLGCSPSFSELGVCQGLLSQEAGPLILPCVQSQPRAVEFLSREL